MAKSVTIIGAGHNGLVCAAYLARAGMDVTVVERRSVVGGAAVTEEFYPGFRNSVASYTVSLLHPRIIKDLNLHKHGLRIIPRRINNYLPLPGGDALVAYADADAFEREVSRFSTPDVKRLQHYTGLLEAIRPVIRDLLLQTPPSLQDGGITDLWKLFSLSRLFKQLSGEQQQFLLNLFSRSAGEILEDLFEATPLQALLGWDAVVGNFASPYAAGSGYVLLHHVVGEVNGISGQWGHAVGGMGAITQAIMQEGSVLGVRFRTDSEVNTVIIENGKTRGVTLANGESIISDLVVSNVTPPLLFMKLIDADLLAPEIKTHFENYKCRSGSFRMNVALSELPRFTTRTVDHYLESGILIAPDLAYMDRAWLDARQSGWPEKPIVELLIPSTIDDTLAPPGQHVASLFCQQFDPGLGAAWEQHREAAADRIIDTVNEYAPNFKASIIGRQVLSPWDLEQVFGLTGGDIFHGRLSLEQLFSARPRLGMGQYRTPFTNLYMCGSGTHPGGGVSGIPGHNAAREIIRDH